MEKIKRGILLSIVFTLILLPSVLGVEINLVKSEYNGWETLQAEINGNFISLANKNVFIYEEGKVHPEAVLYGLIKRGEVYHYYAVLPNRDGNFSLRIENVQYIQSKKLMNEPIDEKFIIKKANETILSINPGFVIVEDEEFFVRIISYNGNQNVDVSFGDESQTISLIDSVQEKAEFSVLGIEGVETSLSVGDYNIPVFILKGSDVVVKDFEEIKISALDLVGNLESGGDYSFEFVLENTGGLNISDIKISSDLDVLIEPSLIEFMEVGEKSVVDITFSDLSEGEVISGEIMVEFGDASSTLPISFEVSEENEVIVDVPDDVDVIIDDDSLSCEGLGGVICLDEKKCNQDTKASLDGPCCLGKCVEERGFNWWMIGLLILLLVGAIVFVFYKKMKKKQVPKSSKEILNDKTSKYRARMKKDPQGEVSRSLRRV
jgi:hypothetical protein